MLETKDLETALTSVAMDLNKLRWVDLDVCFRRYENEVAYAVHRLCEALEEPGADDPSSLARFAHRTVSALSAELADLDSYDRRTRERLELARSSVDALLDELSAVIQETRR